MREKLKALQLTFVTLDSDFNFRRILIDYFFFSFLLKHEKRNLIRIVSLFRIRSSARFV